MKRSHIVFLAVIISCTAAFPCLAEETEVGSFQDMLPRLSIEDSEPGPEFNPATELQFTASGWNVLAGFERVGVPNARLQQPWNRGAYSDLLRDFESTGLLETALYQRGLDDSEFVCLDLRKEEQTLRLARLRSPIEEGTVISAEWLSRSETQPLMGLPVESTKVNIETQIGGLKLYGEFMSSNWNSLMSGASPSLGRAAASSALMGPSESHGLLPGSTSVARNGDSRTFELGAKIPLTADSESRVSFRRGTGSSVSSEETAEELGIEGALRLQDGIKLRAGFAKRTSFSGGSGEGQTEDSVWTGIDIQF